MSTYWGEHGSGLLIRCKNNILLTKRSQGVTEPGTWGLPGGKIDSPNPILDEKLLSAIREAKEELGSLPEFGIIDHAIYRDGAFTYTSFLIEIKSKDKKKWKLVLNWENDEANWFPVDKLPSPLHFGVKYLLKEKPEWFW